MERKLASIAIGLLLFAMFFACSFAPVVKAAPVINFGYKIVREDYQIQTTIQVKLNVTGINADDTVKINVTISYLPNYFYDRFVGLQVFQYEQHGLGDYVLNVPYQLQRMYPRFSTYYRMVVWVAVYSQGGATPYFTEYKAFDLYG